MRKRSAAPEPVYDAPASGRTRRFLEGTAAVAVWMTLGLVFHLSANAYLVLGIPITVIFQRYVHRAPLRAMWVRDAPPFQLGAGGVAVAIILMLIPLADLVSAVHSRRDWTVVAWLLAALAGAWAAAYALRCFRRATFRELLLCLVTAGFVGCIIMLIFALRACQEISRTS